MHKFALIRRLGRLDRTALSSCCCTDRAKMAVACNELSNVGDSLVVGAVSRSGRSQRKQHSAAAIDVPDRARCCVAAGTFGKNRSALSPRAFEARGPGRRCIDTGYVAEQLSSLRASTGLAGSALADGRDAVLTREVFRKLTVMFAFARTHALGNTSMSRRVERPAAGRL